MGQTVPVLDAEKATFLEGGRGLIIGVVSPDGTPCIARAWGLSVLTRDPLSVRLLVPADDAVVVAALGDGAHVAVTLANVRTYRSIQLKGRSLGVEDATDQDRARAQRYIDDFFADLLDINVMSREMCERFVPVDFAACILVIDSLFDQTPGPGAGAELATST